MRNRLILVTCIIALAVVPNLVSAQALPALY
jgi:hypothetical protein